MNRLHHGWKDDSAPEDMTAKRICSELDAHAVIVFAFDVEDGELKVQSASFAPSAAACVFWKIMSDMNEWLESYEPEV